MNGPRRADGAAAAHRVIIAATRWQAALPGALVVAIDGHGASGKSTIAEAVAAATPAALVHTDDFFRPASPAARGDGCPARRQELAGYYDWQRIREQALMPLRAGRAARFRRFDWERGSGLDGAVAVAPRPLVVLEGVFSAAPELSDLVDRAVLVDTPPPVRLRRLHARVAPEDWDDDWLTAELAYFRAVRPASSFDLIVPGVSPDAAAVLSRGDNPPRPAAPPRGQP